MDLEHTIQILMAEKNSVKADKSEAIRYLGYGRNTPDNITDAMIESCKTELESIIAPKCCYVRVPLSFDADSVNLCFGNIQSKALHKNLNDCTEAWIFAATLGLDCDRMIMRYSKTSPVKSVLTDALASSAIEVWCDEINTRLCGEKPCRPRFSPGYGDFDLFHQKSLCQFLDTYRKIGLTLTDSMLMTPSKSVTAVIGIGAKKENIYENTCRTCDKNNCSIRK